MAITKRLRECTQGDLVVMGCGSRPRHLWQVVRMGGKDIRLLAANADARGARAACNPNGFKKTVPHAAPGDTVTVIGNVSELGQSVLDLYREDRANAPDEGAEDPW